MEHRQRPVDAHAEAQTRQGAGVLPERICRDVRRLLTLKMFKPICIDTGGDSNHAIQGLGKLACYVTFVMAFQEVITCNMMRKLVS